MLDKALSAVTGADVVVIDLEDGVPADLRHEAIANLCGLDPPPGAPPTLCRIRAGSEHRISDATILPAWVRGAVLAKAEDVDDIEVVARALRSRNPGFEVWLLIESARGVENLPAMLHAGVDIDGVLLGAGDLRADLGLFDDLDLRQIDFARSRLVYACAAAGVPHVVDTPEAQIDPDDAFVQAVYNARGLGFTGKCAIHPNQLEPIRKAFEPSAEQIAWAHRVLAAEDGARRLGTVMVDEATKRTARRLLAAAEQRN
ncbi:HpcH/HpaI aldolase/citrate lyase family protein [Dactylosporangium sp. CA-092794]|uniref:HpcH/HpaI aldolase/citrate lyase family protein n=1 Tax=Dactylosporangium sp. CA-092794 TaxID=3239929 RepID=UPI003D8F4788